MEADERIEIRIKVRWPGRPVEWVREYSDSFDTFRDPENATLYPSMDAAFAVMDELAPRMRDATLSVVEEGWSGDWSGVSAAEAAFWRS